jgi:5-methylcytosine-specific restriction endonuclease McrA
MQTREQIRLLRPYLVGERPREDGEWDILIRAFAQAVGMPSHRRKFFYNNRPPYECWHCGDPVIHMYGYRDGHGASVHHIDGNPKNNSLDNLVIVHFGCHSSIHHKGKSVSEETRRKIGIKSKGRKASPETIQKLKDSHKGQGKGRKLSEETKDKMSLARRRTIERQRLEAG